MKIATLARRLGLPEGSTNADCLARIERLQAERRRRENAVLVAKMEARHGTASTKTLERHLLAQELGNGLFTLNGVVLTADELQAEVEKQYAEEHAFDDVTTAEPLVGEDIDRAARQLLASRGTYDGGTAMEYLAACREVGAR